MKDLVGLLKAIADRGLMEIAQGYALETAQRITVTGHDIGSHWGVDVEMKAVFDEDTAMTARVLSNPTNWGISDPAWKDFCKEWSDEHK